MAFPTNPANGAIHYEDGDKYVYGNTNKIWALDSSGKTWSQGHGFLWGVRGIDVGRTSNNGIASRTISARTFKARRNYEIWYALYIPVTDDMNNGNVDIRLRVFGGGFDKLQDTSLLIGNGYAADYNSGGYQLFRMALDRDTDINAQTTVQIRPHISGMDNNQLWRVDLAVFDTGPEGNRGI